MSNLIGTLPNQVPTNADLGTMAFQDVDFVRVLNLQVDGGIYLGQQLQLGNNFKVNSTTNAVNYISVAGSATGQNPTVTSGGSDTTVGIDFIGKNGNIRFLSDSTSEQLRVLPNAGAVSFIQVQGATGSSAPVINVGGAAANIDLKISAKGTGIISMQSILAMNNLDIIGANRLTFADPGPDEGLEWTGGNGWKIYESPDDLVTNSSGNLQFVSGGTRKLTIGSTGDVYVSGGATVSNNLVVKNAISSIYGNVTGDLTVSGKINGNSISSLTGEVLNSITKNLHKGAIVDAFIYDTTRDSDGGLWRKRTAWASWYNETLCSGQWLGQAANELAARGDNLLSDPENPTTSYWATNAVTVTRNSILLPDGTYAHLCNVTLTGGSRSISQSFTASATGPHAAVVTLLAGTSTTATLGLYNGSAFTSSVGMVLSGPGTLNGTTWQNVTGLSATVPTKILLVSTLSSGSSYSYLLYPGGTSNTTGNTVYISAPKVNAVGVSSATYSSSPELVVDGSFLQPSSNWTWDSYWTVANGVATKNTATSARITQNVSSIVAGKTYVVTYTAQNTAVNSIKINVINNGADNFQTGYVNTSGVVTVPFTATTSGKLCIFCYDNGVTVTNISCKEVTVFSTPSTPYSQQTGSYYQSQVDNKFYMLGSTYGATTEVFRGNTKEFPAVVAIVAEASRVVIYDLTRPGCPMWMVFKSNSVWNQTLLIGNSITCVGFSNGILFIGTGSNTQGLVAVNFISDKSYAWTGSASYGGQDVLSLSQRNTSGHTFGAGSASGLPVITNTSVNGIATTILPDAPIDSTTGLPVPTIAVATEGGISEIQNTGTVNNYDTTKRWSSIGYLNTSYLFGRRGTASSSQTYSTFVRVQRLTGTVQEYLAPLANPLVNVTARNSISAVGGGYAFNASDTGVSILKDNQSTPTKSMTAYLTNKYPTGWMIGDIRGTYLGDTTVETLTGSGELVTNGTFVVDGTGWTLSNATLTVVNGAGRVVTGSGGTEGFAYQYITTTIGKQYTISGVISNGTNGPFIHVGEAGNYLASLSGTGGTTTFVAVATSTRILIRTNSGTAGATGDFDNISVKETAGINLITNGTFDTDTSGWTPGNATLSSVSGALRITASGSGPVAYQEFATVTGKQYTVTAKTISNTTGKLTFLSARPAGGGSYISQATMGASGTSTTITFTAINTSTRVDVSGSSAFVSGDYFDVDSIEVRDAQNLLLNPSFDTSTANWTNQSGATLNVSSGQVSYTSTGVSNLLLSQGFTTVVGRTYKASMTYVSGALLGIYVGNSLGAVDVASSGFGTSNRSVTFVANRTTTYFSIMTGSANQSGIFGGASLTDVTELVQNGQFEGNSSGWTASSNSPAMSITVNGELQVTAQIDYGRVVTTITGLSVGKTYSLSGTGRMISGSGAALVGVTSTSDGMGTTAAVTNSSTTASTGIVNFVPTASTYYVSLGVTNSGSMGAVASFDNISVKLAEPDRSIKNKGLTIVGTLAKSIVASGSNLVSYSGFSGSNWFEQPYNIDLDFGTGDFCVMGWVNTSGTSTQILISRTQPTTAIGSDWDVILVAGRPIFGYGNGPGFTTALDSGITINNSIWHHVVFYRASGVLYCYLDGVYVSQAAFTASLTDTLAQLRIGTSGVGYPASASSLALWKVGATAPTADQITQIYRDELKLFQSGAQCTIDGTTNNVTGITYDESTSIMHLSNSWGRSSFSGLQRVDSEATSIGALSTVKAASGFVIQGGANSAKVIQPDLNIRSELKLNDEIKKVNSRVVQPFWFTGDGTTTSFVLPLGIVYKYVYMQGLIQREGSSYDYTTSFDGYRWTVTFLIAPPLNYNICIMGTY